MKFEGFRDETFAYFHDLAANNNREWFQEHDEDLEQHVLAPAREVVSIVGGHLSATAPMLAANSDLSIHLSELERKGEAISDAGPYKTSLYIYFWDTRINRLSDATLHIGVGAEGVSLGFSIYEFTRNRRARINQVFKARIRTDLALLDSYIKSSYLRRGYQFHRYAKAPGRLGMREVDAFPSAASAWEDTLGWVVSRHIHTGSSRLTPGSFISEIQESFEKLYPLYLFASDPRVDWKRTFKKYL